MLQEEMKEQEIYLNVQIELQKELIICLMKESARHWRELGYDYCRVNRHTQETNEGQARNLTKYEHIKYKG